MDNTLITALIAAGSALLGALIPAIFSYIGIKRELINTNSSKLYDIRRQEYVNYLDSLQNMINNSNESNFILFQNSTNKLIIYADKKLSKLVNDYLQTIVNRTNSGDRISLEENIYFQTRIVNEMRAEIGITNGDLDQVSLICAFPS